MMFGMNFFMDQLFVSSVLLNAWDVRSVEVGVGGECISVFYFMWKKEQPKNDDTDYDDKSEHCIIYALVMTSFTDSNSVVYPN